jgi:hypothetical protein
MGGFGSGRYKGGGKELTSQFFQIDVRELNRQGRLTSDQSFIVQWVRTTRLLQQSPRDRDATRLTSRTDNGYPANSTSQVRRAQC